MVQGLISSGKDGGITATFPPRLKIRRTKMRWDESEKTAGLNHVFYWCRHLNGSH